MMSFAHFSEIYEICCGMMDEEVLVEEKVVIEVLEVMKANIPDTNRWWEEAVTEIHKEKERELLHV
jgi:hypothetical protein